MRKYRVGFEALVAKAVFGGELPRNVWASGWQCIRALLQYELPDAQYVVLQIRGPVDLPDIEHEGLPVLGAEHLSQSPNVLVLEVPLLRAEVLEALGRLVELRLDAHHDGLAAPEAGEQVERVGGHEVLQGDAEPVEVGRVAAAAARVPDRPVRRVHAAVLERELDKVLPGDRVLLAGAAVVDDDAVRPVRRRPPRRDDHQVDHDVHGHEVGHLVLVAQHRSEDNR